MQIRPFLKSLVVPSPLRLFLKLALCVAWLLSGVSVFAEDPLALARTKNCMNCHSVDRKVLGPAFTEVAKRFADKKDAVATLSDRIRSGSSGQWGVLKMPANPNISQEQSEQLAKWILDFHPATKDGKAPESKKK